LQSSGIVALRQRPCNGIFLASGPRLPQCIIVNAASVLDVYPLMLEILEIPLAPPIDGDVDVLAGLLTE